MDDAVSLLRSLLVGWVFLCLSPMVFLSSWTFSGLATVRGGYDSCWKRDVRWRRERGMVWYRIEQYAHAFVSGR